MESCFFCIVSVFSRNFPIIFRENFSLFFSQRFAKIWSQKFRIIFFAKFLNWVFATNSDFLITISLEPNVADLRYFKLWILLDQIIWIWNIKGLQHRVLKILRFKYLILLQRLNSFRENFALPISRIFFFSRIAWSKILLNFPIFREQTKFEKMGNFHKTIFLFHWKVETLFIETPFIGRHPG